MSQQYYYLDKENAVTGPVQPATLVQLLNEGMLTNSALLCKEGEQEWLPISKISELTELCSDRSDYIRPEPPNVISPILNRLPPPPNDELPPIPQGELPVSRSELKDLPKVSMEDSPADSHVKTVKAGAAEKFMGCGIEALGAGGGIGLFIVIRILYKYFSNQ